MKKGRLHEKAALFCLCQWGIIGGQRISSNRGGSDESTQAHGRTQTLQQRIGLAAGALGALLQYRFNMARIL
jgi:hypothetical protein